MPYPIPNLDGTIIEWLRKSKQPNPFNILLLSEGFANTDNDLKRYKDFTESLIDNFFTIPPFHFCRPYINVFSCFIPSNESGIPERPSEWEEEKDYSFGDRVIFLNRPYISTSDNNINSPPINEEKWREEAWEDPWRTIFSIYINRNEQGIGKFEILEKTRPIDVVKLLQLPDEFEVPPWLEKTTTSIWVNNNSKSFGAICIIANTIQDDGKIEDVGNWNLAEYPPDTPDVDERIKNVKYKPIWRYFVIDMHGFFEPTTYRREDGTTFDLKGGYAEQFVHELGHSFDLADEYIALDEIPPAELQTQGIGSGRYRNVDNLGILSVNADASNLDVKNYMSSDEFLGKLKWRKFSTSTELEKLRSGENIITRQDLEDIDSNIFVGYRENENYERDPRTAKPVSWSQLYLIEGAKYKRDFVRSNFECRMRHSKYFSARSIEDQIAVYDKFKQKNRAGEYVYGSPDFCRVCNYQIRHHITGYTEFGIGGVDRNRLQLLFDNEIMPRIRKSFEIQNRDFGTNYSVAGPKCELASIIAYIMFKSIPSPLDIKFIITGLHVSLYYRGIICDPTFYDLYRIGPFQLPGPDPMADSNLSYTTIMDGEGVFKNWEIVRGIVGTLGELKAYIYNHTMKTGSYAHSMPLPVLSGTPEDNQRVINYFLDDLVSIIYGNNTYVGPDNKDYLTGTPIDSYLKVMKDEWDRWELYKKLKQEKKPLPNDKTLNFLVPLDMSLSLQTVLSL
jgi:hypothetical protein